MRDSDGDVGKLLMLERTTRRMMMMRQMPRWLIYYQPIVLTVDCWSAWSDVLIHSIRFWISLSLSLERERGDNEPRGNTSTIEPSSTFLYLWQRSISHDVQCKLLRLQKDITYVVEIERLIAIWYRPSDLVLQPQLQSPYCTLCI